MYEQNGMLVCVMVVPWWRILTLTPCHYIRFTYTKPSPLISRTIRDQNCWTKGP